MEYEEPLPEAAVSYHDKSLVEATKRLKELTLAADKRIKAPTKPETKKNPLRSLTVDEINDILTVVPKPVSRVDKIADQLHEAQLRIIKAYLDQQTIPTGGNKPRRIIEFVKKKLRMHCLKGHMTPATPIGMVVSDDLGAAVMQGALNTRHKAGSRQNASGGLKIQREVLQIRNRSAPAVTLCFTETETFYTIRENWLPLLVQVRVKDLIYDESKDVIIKTRDANDPSWYNSFETYFNVKIPAAKYIAEIRVRTDVLYIHKLTLIDIVNIISIDGAGYIAAFSPIDWPGGPVIHIIPDVEPEEEGVDPSLIVLKNRLSAIPGKSYAKEPLPIMEKHISGIPGVIDILPIAKKVTDLVVNEVRVGPYAVLIINKQLTRIYGMGAQHMANLCRVCGVTVLDQAEVDAIQELARYRGDVVCMAPMFDLESYIYDTTDPDRKLPSVTITHDNKSGEWTLKTKFVEEYKTILEDINKNFSSLSKIKLSSREAKGGLIVTIADGPRKDTTVVSVIAIKKARDDKLEATYEQQRREVRQAQASRGDDSLPVSILRPPTDISTASNYYIAETAGGTMTDFIDIEGIDINRSYSNYSIEIVNLLGIEAVRAFIVKDIDEVWSRSGYTLQPRSIEMAVDYMTHRGILTPFSTSGITSNPIGFMAKSTVSFATKHLQRAAADGDEDPMKSAPSALATAKRINMATGLVRARHTASYVVPEANKEEENVFNFEAADEPQFVLSADELDIDPLNLGVDAREEI